MTVRNATEFLSDPQAYIAKLNDADRLGVFDAMAKLLGQLDEQGISQGEKKLLSQAILSLLCEWYWQRIAAHRKDWLYAEYLALFILNGLYWVARLHTDHNAKKSHRSDALSSFFCILISV